MRAPTTCATVGLLALLSLCECGRTDPHVTLSDDAGITDDAPTATFTCGASLPCRPGDECSPDDGCNWCACNPQRAWGCSQNGCSDAGPTADAATMPACPAFLPWPGWDCTAAGQRCVYSNGCGGKNYAQCEAGPDGTKWTARKETCVSCPVEPPALGESCKGEMTCPYPCAAGEFVISCGTHSASEDLRTWGSGGACSPRELACPDEFPLAGSPCTAPGSQCMRWKSCGETYDTAYCDRATSAWLVVIGHCAPPTPDCGSSMPLPGSPCSVAAGECAWNNGCGRVAYGTCPDARAWQLRNTDCVPGCPPDKPTSGSSCDPPSATACEYLDPRGSKCVTACFCAVDHRWACTPAKC